MSGDNSYWSSTPAPLMADINQSDGTFTGSITLTSSAGSLSTPVGSLLGLYGVTPVARPTTAISGVTVAGTGSGDVVAASTTFAGWTLPKIVAALISQGILSTL